MDVTVVGSGPNGLAAAVICARAGLAVQVLEAQPTFGGGARTVADPEYDGVHHDICSAIHPLALASPFFAEFDLPARGVELVVPDISYANPLPGGRAAIAYHDLERTCAELDHGDSWRTLLGPLTARPEGVLGFFLGDKRSLPPDLPTTVRTGLRVLAQGSPAWGMLRGEDARALFTGVGTHAISPMPSPVNSGAGVMLATVAHTAGWPVPVGGSQVIVDALLADLKAHGGRLMVGEPVTSPPPGVVIYDTAPTALLDIYGSAVPDRYAKALRRYRYGPASARSTSCCPGRFRGAMNGWRRHRRCTWVAPGRRWPSRRRDRRRPSCAAADDAGRAAASGRSVPYRRCGPPSAVDLRPCAGLLVGGSHRHHHRDVRGGRPGFRDLVVAARCVPAADMAAHNANYVGGDIIVGGATLFGALIGPTLRWNPWTTPIPKAYLCSSATPPGTGVHGMCGYYAARTVLKREFGLTLPSLRP